MMSSGQSPFKEIPIEKFRDFLDSGGRLQFSEETPKQLIDILYNQCFQKAPNQRGTFMELQFKLNGFYSIVCSFF